MKTLKERAEALLERCDIAILASIDENGSLRPVPLAKVKAQHARYWIDGDFDKEVL